jgi:hypothetical protein
MAHLALLALFLLALGSCASIQPPPGGPEDKTPPEVDTTFPSDRSTNVARDVRIQFVFSTNVDRSSFQQSVTVSPFVNGEIRYDWSGYDEVELIFPELLRENTTYTISLNRDFKSRRGNQLASPYLLTFSTGAAIDTGLISGFLLSSFSDRQIPLKELFVFAYDITGGRGDTLDYRRTTPDQLTQPSDSGNFEFRALKVGHTYRVFVVQDLFRNRVYDPGIDGYGIPTSDVALTTPTIGDFRIRVGSIADTIAPALQDVEVLDARHLRVRMTEAIDTAWMRASSFRLRGTNAPAITGAFRERERERPGHITLATGSPLTAGGAYTIEIDSRVTDPHENRVSDSARTRAFTAPETLDTAKPISLTAVSMTDSARDVSQSPILELAFSDALDHASVDSAIMLRDTAGRPLALQMRWRDDAHVTIAPRDTLKALQWHRWTLNLGRIRSGATTNPLRDTTITIAFRTEDARDLGRLSGTILVADSLWARSPETHVVLELLESDGDRRELRPLKHRETDFAFERLPKGAYRVRAFLTFTALDEYDQGSLIPFRFAAPSGEFPGAIEVRPRWSIDRVNFELR